MGRWLQAFDAPPAGVPPAPGRPSPWKTLGTASLAIFAFALAVRLLHLWQIHSAPFFVLRLGDASSYDAWARRIASGNWLGSEVFYQAPLYPYFLAAVYRLAGDGPLAVRLAQAVLGSFGCVLLAGAAARFFSRATGIIAGLMFAVYPAALFFDALIQKSALEAFLLCGLLWILGGLSLHARGRSWLGAGATLGLLVLVRENALALAPVILGWAWFSTGRETRKRVSASALLLLGLALVLLPVAVRNLVVGGEFHLTTAQFGPNFYMGNNANADGTDMPLRQDRANPKFERTDAVEIAERALGRKLGPREVSAYWTDLALGYIRSDPAGWLKLTARKLALFWNAAEIIDTEDQYTHAEWSWPLRIGGRIFHFGVLAPLAVLGACVTWDRRGRLGLLHLLVAAYTASVVAFFVFARYRFPVVPLLIPFAAAGIVELRGFLRGGRLPRVAGAAAATLLAVVVCNWPMESVERMKATTRFNIGVGLEEQGRTDEAIDYYLSSLQLAPDWPPAQFMLANALQSKGRTGEAIEHYLRAIAARPGFAAAHFNLGVALASRGEDEAAMRQYVETLRIDPGHVEARNNLANLLQARGMLDQAIRHYEELLRIAPDHAAAHFNLAVALGKQGKVEEAARHLEAVLRIEPDNAGARRILQKIRGSRP